GKRLLHDFRVADLTIDENPFWGRHIFIELDKKARKNLSFRDVIRMRREEGSMPPILATTNEESLDGHRAGLAGERENVGVPKTFRMDCLAALYIGQCPKPVAVNSGKLVILAASGFRHELGQPCLHASGFAGQEFL